MHDGAVSRAVHSRRVSGNSRTRRVQFTQLRCNSLLFLQLSLIPLMVYHIRVVELRLETLAKFRNIRLAERFALGVLLGGKALLGLGFARQFVDAVDVLLLHDSSSLPSFFPIIPDFAYL